MNEYRIMYHESSTSVKPHLYLFGDGRDLCAEDALTIFRLDKPEAVPLSLQKNTEFVWTLKDELACPYCGGIDAHTPKCRWGYYA